MDKKQLIVDVREPYEYEMGHVENSINIPPTELLSGAEKLKAVDKDTKIILYCKTGARSNASIRILQELGFNNLENGINAGHVEKRYLF